MKKPVSILATLTLVATVALLHAQTAATTIQSGTFTLTPANISLLGSLPDWQIKEVLQTLAATPLIWPNALPNNGVSGTYYSLAHPDWPPLPTTFGSPVWKLSIPSGSDFYLLDDVDYPLLPQDGGTNGGGVESSFQPLVFTTNDLWLQINSVTNNGLGWTANLTVHRPWNDTNLFHDLYYTASLNAPIQWNFAMRCVYTNNVVPDLCSPVGFFRLGPATNGDLTVSTNATPQQLAQMLVPPWVTVVNVKYTGTNVARGTFAGGNGCGLPIDSGVILASGDLTNAIGPNTISWASTTFYDDTGILYSDPDLDKLVGGSGTEDAAVLEFDIISTVSFTLQFQYVFASEEYPEFSGSKYNDPLGIFVSTNFDGTNWVNSITNDLALVPGTTNVPVTVDTINGGCVRAFSI